MVCDFVHKFGLTINSPADQYRRIDHMLEEVSEYREAYNNKDAEGMLDALCDLIYVVLGTAAMNGFNRIDEAFNRVHTTNMMKKRIVNRYSSGIKFGIVKPTGWVPPHLKDLVCFPIVR